MNRPLLVALINVLTACSTVTGATTTNPAVECDEPPAEERSVESALDVRVSPDAASARDIVELAVLQSGLEEDAVVGVDAEWQCWEGTQWVTTHIVYRGFGDNAGQTIPLNSRFQIRIPSIALALDEGYPIVIPQVEPGTYRIEDEALAGGERITGFDMFEVVEN